MDMHTQTRAVEVTAADGRRLEVVAAGPANGLAFILHSGTPAGPVPFPPMIEAAAARGLRTILYARPGYAGSTPQPGRTVADAAGDVAAILDALGHDQFVTAGWSGGGPHALACAARLAGRCRAAATIAGVAPYHAAGLDWLAGMAPENVAEFGTAVAGEAPLTQFLDQAADHLRTVTGKQVAAALGGLVSAVDTAVLTDEFADFVAAGFRAALESGIAGWRDDDLAFVRPWGFALEGLIVTPVAVWQGGQDRMVPGDHGRWLAGHLPGAHPHVLPDEGHLSLPLGAFGTILDDLLELSGAAP
ncbi:MAG TPA: alpha/beta fold hydrolase [Actinomycetes bacterium]|jgi:pimeloyl-ACP methyl ester carboxylesterase|nr:alpha/beta fold hydrolase [Actinomycetes bacterium]